MTLVESEKDVAYWELVVKDIQHTCKLSEQIYDLTEGADGYVSVEIPPRVAGDTKGTVEPSKYLHKAVNRRNVYIKIPATAPFIPSIRDVIASGISVHVTLVFSISRYKKVIDAYLDGLEASGLDDLSGVTSVASLSVSQVDTLVDRMLKKIGTPVALGLRGKAGMALAALAYKLYQTKFSGPRWEALVKKGAKKQRLLWASTSDQAPLIGLDSVSATLDQAVEVSMALKTVGIKWNKVGKQLEEEAVDLFKKSFESLLGRVIDKANALKLTSR